MNVVPDDSEALHAVITIIHRHKATTIVLEPEHISIDPVQIAHIQAFLNCGSSGSGLMCSEAGSLLVGSKYTGSCGSKTPIKPSTTCSTIARGLAVLCIAGSGQVSGEDSINALVWCDHTDPEFIQPFEKANNVRVNLKEFEGTGAALSILEQSRPGDWDVMIIDGVDVPGLVDQGLLASIPEEALPLDDLWPEVVLADYHKHDGQWFGMTELFGYNTIAYNKNNVDVNDMLDMTTLWSGKYKDRIAVYDWHTPMIGLVSLGIGKKTAELSESDLPEIRDTLFKLKENTAQFTDVVASQTALATGEVDILFGGGEWLTGVLSSEMPELDWVLPEQGGLMWSQSVTMLADAANPDMALKFVQYILSPEGQAALATSSCYWAMPANVKTGDVLTDEQKSTLRWNQQAEYLANSQRYPSFSVELDEKMEDLWIEMQQQ